MNKILLSFLVLLSVIIFGCGANYWQYKKGEMPDHINNPRVIPVYIQDSFSNDQIKDIRAATTEWNSVFNGQVILKHEGLFGDDDAMDYLEKIDKTTQGWMVINLSSDSKLAKKVGEGTLAFVPGFGSHLLFILGDRIGTRDLKTIVMHEIGHLLGAAHVNMPNLMIPNYGWNQYNCIDKVTVMQVATFMKLDFRYMNYCVTPSFE